MKEYFKIGQVSKILNLPVKTIRFYEEKGLFKPSKVDEESGYRYFDEKAIEKIAQVQFLRKAGFSTSDIKNISKEELAKQEIELNEQFQKLRTKTHILKTLDKKDEKSFAYFISDAEAVGKWRLISGENPFFKFIYFLPEGKGYWIFERWTKGKILLYTGKVATYSIENDTLKLNMPDMPQELVFKKVDGKKYFEDEIALKENVDFPFVKDDSAVGFWKAIAVIDKNKADQIDPSKLEEKEDFIKKLILSPDGEAIWVRGNGLAPYSCKWTKGLILDQNRHTASEIKVKNIHGKTYMIVDWKSGDYIYSGVVKACYVFEKIS